MTNLISGKDALIALENGEDVEYLEDDNKWNLIDKEFVVISALIDCKLRLKPQTIMINGIEVPACGTNYKPHTFMFVLNSLEPCEYSKIILDESDENPLYWWQTEEEVKQVVAALRQVFGGVK
ncbi:hypothetical protein [Acinetobacter sp. YH12098]|uniref:hypothetical protein n=1 Tax=Acinetobacter sp. YH12098 TaxID=2601087 RepID=UPI0015D132B6|nr:hypothetical protein [Acinetobacter sp. YH12098]